MEKEDVVILIVGFFVILGVAYDFYDEFLEVGVELPSNVVVYSYGPNGLVAKQQGSEVSYYHKDHLGSTSLVSDSEGEIIFSSDYYPYGEEFNSEGEERYGYNSKELDSSGLLYYGARYYDASLGRFISVDPIEDLLFSSYVYVRDNPMKYVDPSGEVPVEVVEESFSSGNYVPLSGFNLDLPEDTLEEFRSVGFEPSVQPSVGKVDWVEVLDRVSYEPGFGIDTKLFKFGLNVEGFGNTITQV